MKVTPPPAVKAKAGESQSWHCCAKKKKIDQFQEVMVIHRKYHGNNTKQQVRAANSDLQSHVKISL